MTGCYSWSNGKWKKNPGYEYRWENRVATKKPNAWGLYDMSGLFLEWVFDSYKSRITSGTDPVHYDENQHKLTRGGSYYHLPEAATILKRKPTYPKGGNLVSFRIARNA